ncbi:MAG: hypothetical protein HeimC3_22290 [Candidatus Heimdallarchaeota archaeon LC_3]|nr:MAG: hypothetical protein HeimC3_22290 [Candidatus Heimdallarchaeota archaeon LC_3]
MSYIEYTKNQINYLIDKLLPVLEKQISAISKSDLNYKPVPTMFSLKELIFHTINSPYLYIKGVEIGGLNSKEFNKIDLELQKVDNSKDLLKYLDKFKIYLKSFTNIMDEEILLKDISYDLDDVGWGTWTLKGFQAMQTAVEELLHHRGQLSLYLRFLDMVPPKIYSYL